MKDVIKYSVLLIMLTFSLQSCMTVKYNLVSPGRINSNSFLEAKEKFTKISNEISTIQNSEVEVIAHGAGSWRYYPMGISRKGIVYGNGFNNKRTKAVDIIEIVDSTLTIDPRISIELDVHYAPVNSGFSTTKGFIIHDQPKWEEKYISSKHSRKYLNENTLIKFLKHFTEKKYHLKSNVYIEIKVKKECDVENASDSCTLQYQKLVNEVEYFAANYKRVNTTNWLNITSFRRKLKKDLKTSFDYVLIVGYTGGKIKGGLAQTKGYVPKYDSSIINFATNAKWLNSIWFSVRGIKNFKEEFNTLIDKRHLKYPDSPLSFSYATYEKKSKKLLKTLKTDILLKGKIRSFMIDIDDRETKYSKLQSIFVKKRATEYDLEDTYESNALIRKFWAANKLSSYLSVPYVTPIKKRRIPTDEGEGEKNLQLLEAYIELSYPLFFGKESNNKLISLEYTANFRMTLDDSKPLTTGSNHIGFSYYSTLDSEYIKPSVLRFLTTRIQLKHYSNGQDPGFYYFDPNNPSEYRNSYLSGDFSTNYLWFQLTKGKFSRKSGSLLQVTGGYRYDMGTDESTFAYTKEQENSYGRHRLTFSYDYRTKRFNEDYEHHLRIESEYIMGDLNEFNPNLVNDTNKYRFNVRALYEFAPKNHYSIGYFISTYYGRDYLNIRFDDIVFSIQAGFTLNLDKLIL